MTIFTDPFFDLKKKEIFVKFSILFWYKHIFFSCIEISGLFWKYLKSFIKIGIFRLYKLDQ